MKNIPVLSVADLNNAQAHQAMDLACREWGFFQIVDHGIDTQTFARVLDEAGKFFALGTSVKRTIARTAANPWGFFDQELTKNTPDWKEILDYGPAWGADQRPQWPREVPGLQAAAQDYYSACEKVALQLVAIMSTNLGMPPTFLAESFAPDHSSFARINYYPPCPTPERPEGLATPTSGHLAVNHHTDAGALTILLQDEQPGLEVLRDGTWHLVETVPGALVVNIGDVAQVWSNDQYIAAIHRVRANKNHQRFSVPFFFNPAYTANYEPLSTTVSSDQPARYRPINWGEFREHRAAGDYADIGDEAHISQYRITASG